MDDQLRKLERAYTESGTEEAAEAYLNARLRAGHAPSMRYLIETVLRAANPGVEVTTNRILEFLDGNLPVLGDSSPAWSDFYVLEDRVDYLTRRLDDLENQL